MTKRVILVHYVRKEEWDEEPRTAVCGESLSRSLLDGTVDGYYRHVYVTLSLEQVTCPTCSAYVGLLILGQTDL